MSDTPENPPAFSGKPETLLAQAGGHLDPHTGAVVPSIQPATTFARDGRGVLLNSTHLYSRDDSENIRLAEQIVACLEGADESLLFASGMAAITTLFRCFRPGQTLLVQSGIYWNTTLWAREYARKFGIRLIEADFADTDAVRGIIQDDTPDLVFAEVPSNPFLAIADIEAIAASVRKAGGLFCVDATVATPLLLQPLKWGADMVVHSATKGLNGHSDVLAGVISAKDKSNPVWQEIRTERRAGGAVLQAFEAWLLIRGMRTAALRVERMTRNAETVTAALSAETGIKILYPNQLSGNERGLAETLMPNGFGGLFSLLVGRTEDDAARFLSGLRLIHRATSLGGVESLAEHRRPIEGPASEVPGNLLRFSLGIEHADDLLDDFNRGLAAFRSA